MFKKKKEKMQVIIIMAIICFGCAVMAIMDGIIRPGYALKSAVKILVFFLVPMIYSNCTKSIDWKRLFRWDKRGMKVTFMLAISVYLLILGAYFVVRNFFDFSKITNLLANNAGVTGDTFVLVALYISLINSLLEEFFFRGFAFFALKKLTSRKFAYIFSSFAFALYHVAMIQGWFSVVLFLLAMIGLSVGGIFFNYLNEKDETIYNSWLVHMFANFAINTVGFVLFGII